LSSSVRPEQDVLNQDPANAVRWINTIDSSRVADVHRCAIGLHVTGVTSATVDARLARARADVVARDLGARLGGTPRIAIAVEAEPTQYGDVSIVLDAHDLTSG